MATAEIDEKAAPEEEADGDKSLLTRFLKLSGYKKGDCDVVHEHARVFLTANGGKYQMNKSGTSLRTLKGPQYPKYEPEV